ncbi:MULTISPECIES: tRNA (adenosine(37)-N6)-dimethylallyltransferase MiaA [Pontibacillus]|uniref:tRNA dimethylallyltransferase n=1 Tax=Pontibacillus chungwhensis TaxID=265426 RepID=A0ABY8V265_9BACI|nr:MULTISPECIES: tRNA (adenosine(37)-N6)-dimethylallyltransferase MiaA [Pontibacillus]MCD5322770.1 tRNA (adenosine(37)-N6)-dimethylallyltransferase MiaA [Pontibacillus sp. HN14]WIG00042.1 tRNA (adenosine(37)-N6)-dimethylallyltransferase MiaA [Pontibacillus chungwhensis]
MKQPVVAIVGPTAVGKTSLSIEIAKRFNGEIISGDSMQIYKGMDIGTAKVTKAEMEEIPHHMIDIKEPWDDFSAAEFQEKVTDYIKKIAEKGKLPIIAGGTGLYIQSVLYDFQFSQTARDDEFRERMEKRIEEEGVEPFFDRLRQIDPEQASKIHPNNIRRVIRALEVYELTGMTMSEYQEAQQPTSPYNPILIGLNMEREMLYNRINTRVDSMIEEGLLDEVDRLVKLGYENAQSMKAIGYKELVPYVKNEQSLEESVQNLKQNSRRYAKRQLTYFRNKMDVDWYEVTVETAAEKFEEILNDLAGKLNQI